MAQFTVNGKTVTVEKNQKLMRYLRDELRLLSVKDGGGCLRRLYDHHRRQDPARLHPHDG